MRPGDGGGATTPGSDPLWAITAYFNPVGYRRRRENFRIFHERLRVPLVAVELGFDGRFDLHDGDADILVRVADGDVMFQKERLLNLAVRHVPAGCRHIAWLDCDVVFERDDWMDATIAALSERSLVQLFDLVDYMPAGWTGDPGDAPEVYFMRRSVAWAIASGEGPRSVLHTKIPGREIPAYSRGFAWAARRSLLEQPGLYDECVLGGGDSALVSAVFGDLDRVVGRQVMNASQEARYRAWARLLQAAGADAVGLVEGRIFHLWHGDIESRGYGLRQVGWGGFDFDPAVDIASGADGAWRWSSAKSAMHAYVANYFVARREDA